jgi:hypothetical protein
VHSLLGEWAARGTEDAGILTNSATEAVSGTEDAGILTNSATEAVSGATRL